jgi:hypothetical protein
MDIRRREQMELTAAANFEARKSAMFPPRLLLALRTISKTLQVAPIVTDRIQMPETERFGCASSAIIEAAKGSMACEDRRRRLRL